MIMGVNTDVSFRGEVFHVQTEDLGDREAILESIVFLRGQSIESLRKPYEPSLRAAPEALRARLIAQHRMVVQAVMKDRFAATVRSLGVVPDRLRLVVSELDEPRAGEPASFLLLLRAEPSCRPVAGATVHVLLREEGCEREIYQGRTDANGFRLIATSLPPHVAPDSHLVLRARCPLGEAEASVLILEPGGARSAPTIERANLIVSELGDLRAGDAASLLILLRSEPGGRPIGGATLRVCLLRGEEAAELRRATTDARGFHLAEFELPEAIPIEASILVEATCSLGTAEALLPVLAA